MLLRAKRATADLLVIIMFELMIINLQLKKVHFTKLSSLGL